MVLDPSMDLEVKPSKGLVAHAGGALPRLAVRSFLQTPVSVSLGAFSGHTDGLGLNVRQAGSSEG